jgi:hypothetical protein
VLASDVLDKAGPEDRDRRLAFRVENDVRRDFATKLAQKTLDGTWNIGSARLMLMIWFSGGYANGVLLTPRIIPTTLFR